MSLFLPLRIVLTFSILFLSLPAYAGQTEGIEYLGSQAQQDGRYASESDIATPYQSTVETLSTLYALGETQQAGLLPGLQFLQNEPFQGAEYLSHLIIAQVQVEQGQPDSSLVSQLQSYQNQDGGFGELPGYNSTPLDTAFAISALQSANLSNHSSALNAMSYLLAQQNNDGGWSIGQNTSQIYVTTLCLQAIAPYSTGFQGVPNAISLGKTFLYVQREANGLWQEDFQSAAVVLALIATNSSQSDLQASITALTDQQHSNGSWQEDVFTTALVLKALQRYESRAGGVDTSQSGTVIGSVIVSGSGEPIAAVTVASVTQPGISVLTGNDGYFRLTGLPAGTQSLLISKTGYSGANSVVTVFINQQSDIGQVALALNPEFGLIRGLITDGHDQTTLEAVNVSLIGPQAYQGTTNAQGVVDLANIVPGNYTFALDRTGYVSLTGELTVNAGNILTINQSLVKTGAFLDDTPGDITGRVLDGLTNSPVAGAFFNLTDGTAASTDTNGRFTLSSLPRGSYAAQVGSGNYQTQTLSFEFAPGLIGNLGDILLFPTSQVSAPTYLTVLGEVIDGVTGQPVNGATVQLIDPAQSLATDDQGQFVLSDIFVLDIELLISAEGYSSRTYTLSASGFGELQQSFVLPPSSTDTGSNSSILSGIVKDGLTGLPISGVTVRLADASASTTSDSSGQFLLNNITELEFTVEAFSTGYLEAGRLVTLSSHGNYTLDMTLNAIEQNVDDQFQIVNLTAPFGSAGAGVNRLFEATVANLTAQPIEALIIGDIVNANSEIVATVTPYLPGTTEVDSHFTFDSQEQKVLTIPWSTAQNAPGTYQLILRVVEPSTLSSSLPTGVVLAENQVGTSVQATTSFTGTLDLNPPITQAGTQVPIQLNALMVNNGNVPLANSTLQLSVYHPDTGALLHQITSAINNMAVSDHMLINFGEWIPTAEGDLPITIEAEHPALLGQIDGQLYVGDKATGSFTVDKNVVPEGDQTLQANITLDGVDTARGTTIDPLFFAVQQAVITGGAYTAREALSWQKRSRCMGCHIQTQSLVGVASAYQKGLGDQFAANTMYNTVASSQQEDGGLRSNHPQYTRTQTALGVWSLTAWDNIEESFRTLYKAAKHMYDRRSQSGNQTWWRPDHSSGWWNSNESHTAMTVKAYVDLLKTSEQIDLSTISDYSLQSFVSLGSSSSNQPLDMESGSDGLIYSIKRNGDITQIDPLSGAVQVIGNSGHNSYGLAIDQDGTQYIVGDSGRLSRRNPDGTIDTLLSGGGTFTDVEFGTDGLLYIVDYSNHRLLRVTNPDSGQVQVVAQGGLLRSPYGLAFDTEGNAIIANYNGWNIIKVAMNGAASVFADGLAYRPIWITPDQQGGFYYSSLKHYSSGQSTPAGINHLSGDGVIERLRGGDTLRGTVVLDGQLYVASYNANQLYKVVSTQLNTALLANYSNEITRATNYFLARYRDNTSNNILQAMRLTGLAEARQAITDQSLLTQIDTAIDYIEGILRARQRSDGGWGRYTSNSSDAMVTALVGLAQDYTNPSADDPMVRNTIQYLLSTQLSDHSWSSSNRILGTRLAATSLVVAYLPVALERLGGIDVDLHLTMPSNISLLEPSVLPTSQTPGVDNQTHYLWQLLGVTSNSQQLVFDLDLLGMELGEDRSVASEAYIEFKNSFTDELIRVDLSIPSVHAASELRLQVETDKQTYLANEQVEIDLSVSNTGPTVADGYIELMIRAPGAAASLEMLDPLIVPAILSGQQQALVSGWLTATTLAGDYEVFAQLFDTQDRLLDQQTTPFKIVHGDSPVIDGSIVTDKPLYQAWDQVIIDGRIENTSANVIHPPTRYKLSVTDPNGALIYSQAGEVNELVAGALQDRSFELGLADAVAGEYAVTWLIQDAFSRELLATRLATFMVERQALQGLSGLVDANPVQVFQGDPVQCTEQVTNLASSDLAGLTLTSQLISVESSQVLQEASRIVDLTGGLAINNQRDIATLELEIGEYACVLHAEIDGQTRQLGAAIFAVLEPPINIAGNLSAGDRGRVLVLMDDAPQRCDGFSQLKLETTFTTPLAANTSVTTTLYDTLGTLVDQEIGLIDDRLVDQSTGTNGIDLIVDDIAPTHLASSVSAATVLDAGYQLVIATTDGTLTETFDSGMIPTNCSETLTIGDVYGDSVLTDVVRLPAANDPLGPNHTPDLATQRTALETLLSNAGWSYTIATTADDFTRELRTGGYVTYLLLSEKIKLEETVQKELREAVYRGEGLIEAGSHDQRQGRIDDALGVQFQGKHPNMQGVSLTQNAVTPIGEIDFQLNDRTLRATLDGATALAYFIDQGSVSTEPAITVFNYGQGRSLYIGFDLAAESALSGADPLLDTLLLDGLSHVHPDQLSVFEHSTYPARITLDNLGIATPGQVILTIPTGVSIVDAGDAAVDGQNLIWPFDLAEPDQLTLDAWLTLPAEPVLITAVIQSGITPNWIDQSTASLTITPEALMHVDAVHAQAELITDKAYKQVKKYLGWANDDSAAGRWDDALSALLRASDALVKIGTPDSEALRIDVAQAIRTVALNL